MNAESLLKGIKAFLNHGDLKTSPLMYDPEYLENKVALDVYLKDEHDNCILKKFHITIEQSIPATNSVELAELYSKLFD
jgi:hypothetical protein